MRPAENIDGLEDAQVFVLAQHLVGGFFGGGGAEHKERGGEGSELHDEAGRVGLLGG